MKVELMDSPPPSFNSNLSQAGWIQKGSLTQRFKHFARVVKPSKKDPLILTLDGHYSHSRKIEMIDCARENGGHIVCLRLRSTHKLQPLGVPFI